MKRLHYILLLLLVLLSIGAYTGPGDRTVEGGGATCWRVKRVSDGSIVTHSCDYADIRPYEDDDDYRIIEYHGDRTYDPATITADFSCALPGNGGWCRSLTPITYTVLEPIPGQIITIVEGAEGTRCTVNAASGSCQFWYYVGQQQGERTWTSWAVSS